MGMMLTVVFTSQNINPANTTGNGLFFGETKLFMVQLVAMIGVSVFVFGATVISQHGEKL
jgi:Amt family ammonium transporter